MSLYLTEEEQIDRFKMWWKKYGNTLLTVILIIVIAYTGWRWQQQRTSSNLSQASAAYEQILVEVAVGDVEDIEIRANDIMETYSNTIYAQMAALLLAQQVAYAGDLPAAAQHLQWVIDQSRNNSLKQIAKIRAARIFLADEESQLALEVLQPVDDKVFLPLIEQMRGDIYLHDKDYDKARQAYNKALEAVVTPGMVDRFLQMKLNNLPPSTEL
ncbi:MAG: tetratricopeptide repeat protein [Gammaproteobacteria bacterium]